MTDIIRQYRYREFIDYVENNTDNSHHSNNFNKPSFTCSWSEALKLAKYGVRNQDKIQKIVKEMNLLEYVKTKIFTMAETGLCVDVGSYLNGEPECFIAEDFDYRPKKCVKIIVNTVMCWMINSSSYQNRGAGIISLIQMLKKQGYIVKVLVYSCVIYNSKKHTFFLKIPSDPLDIQSLSYCLCSESLTRRLVFAWLELESGIRNCGSYGVISEIDEVAISKDIIHFNGIDREKCSYNNEKETKDHIVNLFDRFLELNREVNKVNGK